MSQSYVVLEIFLIVYIYFKIIKSVLDIQLFNQNWNLKGPSISICKNFNLQK